MFFVTDCYIPVNRFLDCNDVQICALNVLKAKHVMHINLVVTAQNKTDGIEVVHQLARCSTEIISIWLRTRRI